MHELIEEPSHLYPIAVGSLPSFLPWKALQTCPPPLTTTFLRVTVSPKLELYPARVPTLLTVTLVIKTVLFP